MAGVQAIRSVGESIADFLTSRAQPLIDDGFPVRFQVLSSGELASEELSLSNVVSLYLYRVTVNEQLRSLRPAGAGTTALPLDLHYLLSVWADSASREHTLLAWTLRTIHENPILDASALRPEGGWAPDEVVHIAPEEISNEDLLRLWDAISPSYRVSYSYVARVVVLDPERVEDRRPVVAHRRIFEGIS